jgi:hypothetical protein
MPRISRKRSPKSGKKSRSPKIIRRVRSRSRSKVKALRVRSHGLTVGLDLVRVLVLAPLVDPHGLTVGLDLARVLVLTPLVDPPRLKPFGLDPHGLSPPRVTHFSDK